MSENVTITVSVEITPFGTIRATERVHFEPPEKERETIASFLTTAACESDLSKLPYVLR